MVNEEVTSTDSEVGAGNQSQQQDAETQAQAQNQGQSSEGAHSRVDSTSTDASSVEKRGRSFHANQRQLEKAIRAQLDSVLAEKLNPIIEKISSAPQTPQKQVTQEEQPDWNNLNEWIKRQVGQNVQESVQPHLSNLQKGLMAKIQGEMKMQEARNYLLSQPDIGNDEEKKTEIQEIMVNNLLHYALDDQPLEATKRAVEIWRNSKKNPNAPPKSHLTTVQGSGISRPTGEPTLKELKALEDRLIKGGSVEEMEKLSSEIDALVRR